MPSSATPSPKLISIKVLFFAAYAELVGRPSVELEVPASSTVADVIRHLRVSVPGASRLPERPMAAIDQVHAHLDHPVASGAELALLPPMAGG